MLIDQNPCLRVGEGRPVEDYRIVDRECPERDVDTGCSGDEVVEVEAAGSGQDEVYACLLYTSRCV